MSLYLAVFGKPRYLGLVDIGDLELKAGRWIVIETLRGVEMGLLGGTLSGEQEGKYRSACLDEPSDEHTKGPEPMLQEVEFVGPASESQVQEHDACRLDEEAVLTRSRQILRDHQFQMKLVDVEYTMDRKKLFFYFTSEQRVDFRAYVRDLAKEFRIRIEMRQIGVRDEAKTVRGVSPCGRPCCCSYWLHKFTPICIRMVKEQNLALNPAKISGLCGRLMCCMSFEYEMYEQIWSKLPNPGSKLKTPNGNYILDGIDLKNKSVFVRFPEGKEVPIPLDDFDKFKNAVIAGEAWDTPGEYAAPRLQSVRQKKEEAASESSGMRRIRPVQNQGKISLEEHLAGKKNSKESGREAGKENTGLKMSVRRAVPEIKNDAKNEDEKREGRGKHKPHRKKFHKHKHGGNDGANKE
ncbi:MAG: hypothetical protein FWG09_02650 [Synergistaceae bacterium]|nr:hypothetical protein [Synergistaceae bacterium]